MRLTREIELTTPVDLALPDGITLNPAARGWSRRPLHTANLTAAGLAGRGRTKRWDYWAILAGDLVVSCVYADVDYVGLADVWWVDLATGRHGGRGVVVPGASGFWLPERPGTDPLRLRRRHLRLDLVDDPGPAPDGSGPGTSVSATWTEPDGRPGRLEARVELPAGHESLNVVIPWSGRRFQYTSKHQARPTHGVLEVGDDRWTFGGPGDGDGAGSDGAWGVLDVGRGRWPYRTRWNWGGGAGRSADRAHVVGLQLGGRWTEGTGFTENGVIVDGRLHKLGDELRWDYDWDRPTDPWRVTDPGGRLDLVLRPRYDKHTRIEALVMGTETHQVFGHWTGRVVTDDDTTIELDGIEGFAEESRSRW